jgi:hypothetical protein
MLKPSLYALYKQGRFRKPGFEVTDEGMRQVERFSMAILAFALEHDQTFRNEFLQRVCGRNQAGDVSDFLVELEVAGCGDLVLRKKDDSEAYVLEFKVDSPIQQNQHPRNPEFFTKGYGGGIKSKPWKNSVYILVQNAPEDLGKPAEAIPICRARSWRDVYSCPHERPLVHDLFESFGSLGIPAFMEMNTKDISLGHDNSTLDAVKLYKVLQAVAGRIGSKGSQFDVDLDREKNGGYIGMNFLSTLNSDEWQTLVRPKDNLVGWFGYSQYEKSTLDVWFYCGDEKASARIRGLLPTHFPRRDSPPDAKNYVWVSLPAGESDDNQGWFVSVFESLIKAK